jgi:predicted acetyltransferase
MGEVSLISALRNRATFDSELSLVAEHHGSIVGHALFTPQQVRVKGETLHAVILGPVAVRPKFQKRGVGSMLIEEGHKRATQKGYHFSLLLGHPAYYPRFGYRTTMFGSSHIHVHVNDIPSIDRSITERRVKRSDIEELTLMWEKWFGDSSLALIPGTTLLDWISYSRGITASAISIDEQLSGYVRYDLKNPKKIISFLAKSPEAVSAICSYMKTKLSPDDSGLLLPASPDSSSIKEFVTLPYQPEVNASKASMIKVLSSNPSITAYCHDVEAGTLSPGNVIWPVEFDVV